MKFPKGGGHLYDKFARRFFVFYKNAWVNLFLAPILLAVPPVVITSYYAKPYIKDMITSVAPEFAEFLTQHDFGVIVFATLYPPLILGFATSIGRRVMSRGLDVIGLLHLMSVLDGIVGCKANRFGKYVVSLEQNQLKRNKAFCEITQPTTQIAEIVRGVCELFNSLNSKEPNLIKVILAEMKDGKIVDIRVHFPADEPVRSSIDSLNHPNSSIMTAFNAREMVVVEDTKAEVEKGERKTFVATGKSIHDGSLICYPIIYVPTDEVPYVISIHCDQKEYFKKEYVEIYEHNLQRFALRICLEHSLLLIKEKLCEPAKKAI